MVDHSFMYKLAQKNRKKTVEILLSLDFTYTNEENVEEIQRILE